ncbi:hypothetical protein EMA8858_03127 [Emticicia aquatica]|uniref:DUF2247 family protein n=1 Tax=Emticicia aquatica TaxID=1681835 RepID=A0ABN8EXV5_9BACT|nr:hypothetical protein [Emticicia aquatica]CAH0996990.1 hypothetical protein EMA8858_03127 [Emticicia aquatica]
MESSDPKKEKRLLEFKEWLIAFKEYSKKVKDIDIIYIDDAEEILNDWYWYTMAEKLYPYMEQGDNSRINHSKIISGKELTIMAIQPIQFEDEITEKKLNAELAWVIAWSILSGWNNYDNDKVEKILDNKEIQLFIKEHMTWLEKLDPEFDYPYFSNAQTWRVFNLYLQEFLKNIN